MRRAASTMTPSDHDNRPARLWPTLQKLWPYVWQYRFRVITALLCLIAAKMTNVTVPMVLKEIIDSLTPTQQVVALPAMLLLLYGFLRLSTSLFTELREILFIRVTQRVVRQVALSVFEHLHSLSLRFHLERQTGGVSRDIERGTRAISSLISYSLYSIFPTIVELTLVMVILYVRYHIIFVLITFISLVCYIIFTVIVTNLRTHLRRSLNEADSKANTRAIDSLINYETVKYFNNEAYEAKRYDHQLQKLEVAANKSQLTLSFLNTGQQLIIAAGVTAMMWFAADGVLKGSMSIGDLVLVNAFLVQLYIPLNFLGVLYREIRQAVIDIESMFDLLLINREIADSENAIEINPNAATSVAFNQVSFSYDNQRPILREISFTIPAGKKVAVVGESGAGKSTLSRLIFRFFDVNSGSITLNGNDLRQIKQSSLRKAIAIVPQDTVLFNDTIYYNIAYGRPEAKAEEIYAAAQAAHLDAFIAKLPDGYQSTVGERGLKLSGGEKQRVAIARALLKNPAIMIFDEATSALDSATEQSIQDELDSVAIGRTTLVIAHRLSTIKSADWIIVLANGQIVEQGTHQDLLAANANYAQMWILQQHGVSANC